MLVSLPSREIVLLGVGHTNAHVLRMWKMRPPPDARLTCISNFSRATYSGMLPGVLAGQYSPDEMTIDLVRLCASAGARLIEGEVAGVDLESQTIEITGRPSIPFDVLSIGIGSEPSQKGLETSDETLLPIKPMQTFIARLEARLKSVADQLGPDRPLRIAVVGAGVGGVEITFCLPARVRKLLGDTPVEFTLINSDDEIPAGAAASTQRKVKHELSNRNVRVIVKQRVVRASGGELELEGGETLPVDIAIWATGAKAPTLLERIDLPKDDRGFLMTKPTLQVLHDASIFAVGDTGTSEKNPTPKAGVFAVRQGPVLWENIQNTLKGAKLRAYVPQTRFLKLLNTGDGDAIGEYLGFSWKSRACLWLKDRIDVQFMQNYQNYDPMPMQAPIPRKDAPMPCAGCGGKVGGGVLKRALERIDQRESERVLVGLRNPDDDALFQAAENRLVSVTTDFFALPVVDPWLAGRIAALNAASDAFASGARPVMALAMATLPAGSQRRQQQMLYELLAGGIHEFEPMGVVIAGGHTTEGPQPMIGFTVLADQRNERFGKGELQDGDRLILTKPLGVGVLLASHMRADCRWNWFEAAQKSMLLSNEAAAALARRGGVAAATDVTGFGLAGHLLEMLRASRASASLSLRSIPLLPGAAEQFKSGLESTLAPANRAAERSIRAPNDVSTQPQYAALFDPQTSGGLLLAVSPDRAAELIAALCESGYAEAADIGTVHKAADQRSVIEVSI